VAVVHAGARSKFVFNDTEYVRLHKDGMVECERQWSYEGSRLHIALEILGSGPRRDVSPAGVSPGVFH
jgi:hypothetical protein